MRCPPSPPPSPPTGARSNLALQHLFEIINWYELLDGQPTSTAPGDGGDDARAPAQQCDGGECTSSSRRLQGFGYPPPPPPPPAHHLLPPPPPSSGSLPQDGSFGVMRWGTLEHKPAYAALAVQMQQYVVQPGKTQPERPPPPPSCRPA